MWVNTFRRETPSTLFHNVYITDVKLTELLFGKIYPIQLVSNLRKWLQNLMKCDSIKVRKKNLNVLTGPCDLQGFKLMWNKISHCRLFIETLPPEMFWLDKMKLVKWLTLEWQEMYKNKIFMKGRQRFVLYWKLTYSIGMARNPLPLPGGKYVRSCWLCRCFLSFML